MPEVFLVFLNPCSIFFSVQVISPPLCLSRLISRCPLQRALFLFSQVNAPECVPSISAVQPRPHWLDLTDPISSDCGLPLSFKSSYYSVDQQGTTISWRLLSLCSCSSACRRPRLVCERMLSCDKGVHEKPAPSGPFYVGLKWCRRCMGLHRLFWLPGLLSAGLCGMTKVTMNNLFPFFSSSSYSPAHTLLFVPYLRWSLCTKALQKAIHKLQFGKFFGPHYNTGGTKSSSLFGRCWRLTFLSIATSLWTWNFPWIEL